MRSVYKCFECKNSFNVNDMIQYASLKSNTMHRYCKDCYQKKLAREQFENAICEIFGVKSPGPMMWSQRKAIMNRYGYTDNTIIECLKFMYNVLHYEKIKPTLGLVTPFNVEKMMQYKKTQDYKNNQIAQSFINNINPETIRVHIKENVQENNNFNIDEFLTE